MHNFNTSNIIEKFRDVFNIIPKTYDCDLIPKIDDCIMPFFYEGMPYSDGRQTRIFAYLGLPKEHKIKINEKLPAVVLVHGGGGTAFFPWVKQWVDRGYAAIAMSLEGNIPIKEENAYKRHDYSGPSRKEMYDDYEENFKDQWFYHAISAIILANTYIRGFDIIDKNKIGIVGISWGGVLTSTMLGIDKRYAFAVPIYGCSYLYESWNPKWNYNFNLKKQYDPSNFLYHNKTPLMFINGDTDGHFSINITDKSKKSVPHSKLLFIHNLLHGGLQGWSVQETYVFADSIVRGSHKLTEFIEQSVKDNLLTASFKLEQNTTIQEAYLLYTDKGKFSYEVFKCLDSFDVKNADINKNIVSAKVPEKCMRCYFSIKDSRGNMASSDLFLID